MRCLWIRLAAMRVPFLVLIIPIPCDRVADGVGDTLGNTGMGRCEFESEVLIFAEEVPAARKDAQGCQ